MKPLLLTLTALLLGVAPYVVSGQTVQATPLSANLPKACWPESLLTGKDTAWLYVPCRSLEVLHPVVREQVECMLARQRKGKWPPLVQETRRSKPLQDRYYQQGRTRPGPRITNVKDVATGMHGYGLAADVISATKGWNDPKFFYWQAQHAESCGLVAGAFWKKFPDAPHVQYAGWGNSPPLWARGLLRQDSLPAIWRTIYPPTP